MRKCKYSNSKCTDCKLCEPIVEINEDKLYKILNIIEKGKRNEENRLHITNDTVI
jgi:hypothetical protein